MQRDSNNWYWRLYDRATAVNDDGFCGVGAMAAVIGCQYKRAYDICAAYFERRHGHGTAMHRPDNWARFSTECGKRVRAVYIDKASAYGRFFHGLNRRSNAVRDESRETDAGMTLATVGKRYPKGRFVVLVRGHTVGMRNGKLHDWTAESAAGLRRRVQLVIQVGGDW